MPAPVRLPLLLLLLLLVAAGLPAAARAAGPAEEGFGPDARPALPGANDARYSLAGRWRFDSGSTVDITEYGPAPAARADDPGDKGRTFIGLYVEPAPSVAEGGARPGMFSLVGFRQGNKLSGKLWLFLVGNESCYPGGQARDFTGEISPDGRTMAFFYESLKVETSSCGIAGREPAAISAAREPANLAN